MFAADAPFCVSAGEAIPMDAKLVGGDCFEVCDGCIRIHKAGIYYAVWTLNVPSYRNLCSRLYLTLNGNEVAGSSQTICCQADNTSTSVTGQALISVPTGGVVCLVSESAMCLDGSCNVENVATLSIRRAE